MELNKEDRLQKALDKVMIRLITSSLILSGGNVSEAARRLKTTKRKVAYHIKRLGIKIPDKEVGHPSLSDSSSD